MADPKSWTRPSGTVCADCPRCAEAGELAIDVSGRHGNDACEVCGGKGEVGLATAVAWILAHGKTDPPPDTGRADPDEDTKPE
jgi:hypothetical protein